MKSNFVFLPEMHGFYTTTRKEKQRLAMQFKTLRSAVKQKKNEYINKKKNIECSRNADIARLQETKDKLFEAEQKIIEDDYRAFALREGLKCLEYQCFWKGVHRKHIREDLNDLKVSMFKKIENGYVEKR